MIQILPPLDRPPKKDIIQTDTTEEQNHLNKKMRSFDENLRVEDKEENPNNALLPLLDLGKVAASEIVASSPRRKLQETSETNDKTTAIDIYLDPEESQSPTISSITSPPPPPFNHQPQSTRLKFATGCLYLLALIRLFIAIWMTVDSLLDAIQNYTYYWLYKHSKNTSTDPNADDTKNRTETFNPTEFCSKEDLLR